MIADSVRLGQDVVIHRRNLVNLYGTSIGDGSCVGTFVEIQPGAEIGRNCKISSHSFICEGVTIEDGSLQTDFVRNFMEVPDCRVGAVADMPAKRLARMSSRYPTVQAYGDFTDLMPARMSTSS